MTDVYGDWMAKPSTFVPKPLPPGEAGDFKMESPGVIQRRYLWVDAWGSSPTLFALELSALLVPWLLSPAPDRHLELRQPGQHSGG